MGTDLTRRAFIGLLSAMPLVAAGAGKVEERTYEGDWDALEIKQVCFNPMEAELARMAREMGDPVTSATVEYKMEYQGFYISAAWHVPRRGLWVSRCYMTKEEMHTFEVREHVFASVIQGGRGRFRRRDS